MGGDLAGFGGERDAIGGDGGGGGAWGRGEGGGCEVDDENWGGHGVWFGVGE